MAPNRQPSLQFGIFSFSLLKNRNIGVGIFPEREEILIGRAGAAGVACFCSRSRQAEMRQRAGPTVPYNPAMIEQLLEFSGRGGSLLRLQIRFTAQINLIHAGVIETPDNLSKLVRRSGLKQFDRLRSISAAELD